MRCGLAHSVHLPSPPAPVRQNEAGFEVELGAVRQSPDLSSAASMHGIRIDVEPPDAAQFTHTGCVGGRPWKGSPEGAKAESLRLPPIRGCPCGQVIVFHDRSDDREAMEASQEDGQIVRVRCGHSFDGATAERAGHPHPRPLC